MKIGYSLSGCIRDIIEYNIDISDVYLITGTRFGDLDIFKEKIKGYKDSAWSINYDKCEAIAIRLFTEGRIYQPRLNGDAEPNISKGRWYDEAGNKLIFSKPSHSESISSDSRRFMTTSIR